MRLKLSPPAWLALVGALTASILLAAAPTPAVAQNTLKVVSSCPAALGTPYTVGQFGYPTMDVNGNTCGSGSGGGGGSSGPVYGPDVVGSPVAHPPIITGYQDASGNAQIDTGLSPHPVAPYNAAGVAIDLSVPPTAGSTNGSSTITTGGTFQTLLAASASRKGCYVQNNNTADSLWVDVVDSTGSATKARSTLLLPGTSFNCSTGALVITDLLTITGSNTGDTFVLVYQ